LGSNRDHDSADFEWCVSSVMSGNHSFSHWAITKSSWTIWMIN
jgi:hypothetical protein